MRDDDLFLAYMAGFFDADGSVGIYAGGGKGRTLRVQVTQNVTPESMILLDAISLRWGGHKSVMNRKLKRQAYNWQASGLNGYRMLAELLPHLKLKRAQAELATEWWDGRLRPQRDGRGRMAAITPEARQRDDEYDARLRAMKKGD